MKKFAFLITVFAIALFAGNCYSERLPNENPAAIPAKIEKAQTTNMTQTPPINGKTDSNAKGNVADNAKIEKAIQWAIAIAKDPVHGYSQGAENATAKNPYTGSRESPDYDCSSLVYHALEHAGFGIIEVWHKNPEYMARYQGKQYSGDADTVWMDLKVIGGFKKYSWNEVKNSLKRGDILCDPSRHIAFYIGNGQTVEARGVNNPRGGGYQTGDQGGEIGIYEAQNRGWKEVYRYVGK